MKPFFAALLASVLVLSGWAVRAQWVTQSISLQPGWNAVFLHVDASHATLDQLVGAGAAVTTPIEEVWRWNPNPEAAQFIVSPEQPINTDTRWASWRRSDSAGGELRRLTANTAYLIHSTNAYTLSLKGRPVLPVYDWTTSGLNFLGFPTVPTNPPSFETFLTPAPDLLAGEIFRYPGGPLGPTNPGKVFALRTTPVRRGEAFWIRAGDAFETYAGPFVVMTSTRGEAAFGNDLGTYSFRLRNRLGTAVTVRADYKASEAPPAGQAALTGTPPLMVRGTINPTNLTHGFTVLPAGGTHSWTLAPAGQAGAEIEVVLGLDRTAVTGQVGDQLAGVLQFTDSLGQTRVDLGVSATVASPAGLWVGAASVTEVSQYLQQYLRDGAGQLEMQTNGAYVVTGVVTNLTPVPPASAFPLRLIVHNPDRGAASLWQRLYLGFNTATNPIIANREEALFAPLIRESRRVSATHLPWSEENPGWNFSGPLGPGAVVLASITNRFDRQESNPFLHTYHPDHDNLDASFAREVPQGSESYTLVREIALQISPPGDDFRSRTGAGTVIRGDYLESLRVLGLARSGNVVDTRRFDVRGRFELNRISEITTVQRQP